MIILIEPYASGNALHVLLHIAPGAKRVRLLRKQTNDFTGQDDPAAVLVMDGLEPSVTDVALVNGQTYWYADYAWDGVQWTLGSVMNGQPGYALLDQSVDVQQIVRDRIRAGLASEVAAGRIYANADSGRIEVLNAPPQFENTRWPVVTVHVTQDASGERAIGEELHAPEPDADKWQETEGWLSRWELALIVWSQNPDERIALRQSVKRLVIGNLPVLDGLGIMLPDLSWTDVDHMTEYPAPVYCALGKFQCLAPSSTSRDEDAIAGVTVKITTPYETPPAPAMIVPPHWPWRGFGFQAGMATKQAQPGDVATLVAAFPAVSVMKLWWHAQDWQSLHDGSTPADALAAGHDWLNSTLDACASAGIGAVCELEDWTSADGAQFVDMHSAPPWEDPDQVQAVIDQSATFAAALAGRGPELVAYQMLSEPVIRNGGQHGLIPGWAAVQSSMLSAMRAADPTPGRWNVVQPDAAASMAYPTFSPLSAPRLVYCCHNYSPQAFAHQGTGGYPNGPIYPGVIGGENWDSTRLALETVDADAFSAQNAVPMWLGEFGAHVWAVNGEQYCADDIANIEARAGRWGWCYHSFGGTINWDLRYSGPQESLVELDADAPRWQAIAAACAAIVSA